MRLKSGEFLIKEESDLAWGCFLKNGGRGSFVMKNVYKNLIQMPKELIDIKLWRNQYVKKGNLGSLRGAQHVVNIHTHLFYMSKGGIL